MGKSLNTCSKKFLRTQVMEMKPEQAPNNRAEDSALGETWKEFLKLGIQKPL